jgi:hypothetical protein
MRKAFTEDEYRYLAAWCINRYVFKSRFKKDVSSVAEGAWQPGWLRPRTNNGIIGEQQETSGEFCKPKLTISRVREELKHLRANEQS